MMNSPPDSPMDDMLGHTTLQNYGTIRVITIPGIEILSQLEQVAVAMKAE